MKLGSKLLRVLVCVLAFIAYARSASVTIMPAAQHIEVDSVGVIRVHVQNIEHLHAYSVQVSYNPLVVRCQVVRRLSFFTGGTLFFSRIDSLNGTVTVEEALLGPSGQSGSGDLVELRFRGTRAGLTDLRFAGAAFRDTTNQIIAVTLQGGSIQVGRPNAIREGGATNPVAFELQNYPNPFNSATTLAFSLVVESDVMLTITNVAGEKTRTLCRSFLAAGKYSMLWDGTNDAGEIVASGNYFARLRGGQQISLTKMLLVK